MGDRWVRQYGWADIPNNAKYIVNTANSVNKNDKKNSKC